MKSLIVTLLILLLVNAVSSQNLSIPYGSIINNDGNIGVIEWMDADSVMIQSSAITNTRVLFKHDGQSLHIAFVGNLQTPYFYFPEINIDTDNNKSTSFYGDDWWFHVSATDCEQQGNYGVYHNCQAVRPNWTANPNFNASGPPVDQVEVSIPLQNIGLNTSDTIGLLFFLNNFQNFKYHKSGAHHLNPSTWQTAVFEPITTSILERSAEESLSFWPNPAEQFLTVSLNDPTIERIAIRDVIGKQIIEQDVVKGSTFQLDISQLTKGIYFLEWGRGGKVLRKKMIKF